MAKGVFVFEHAACDQERRHPTGNVERAWLINTDGIHPTDTDPDAVPDDRDGMWFCFARCHYYIEPEGSWLVLSIIDGPRAGLGGCYTVAETGDQFVPQGPSWKA